MTVSNPNEVIRRLHAEGYTIGAIAQVVGLGYEVTRGRGRRMGLKWETTKPTIEFSGYYQMSEADRADSLFSANDRLLAALAKAFARGEHLPAMRRAA